MSTKKIIIIVVIVLALAGVTALTVLHSQAAITKVATGKVVRQDLVSTVSGTGQIKPKTYVNIGATSFGRITHLYVRRETTSRRAPSLPRLKAFSPRLPSRPNRPASPRRGQTSPPSLPPRIPPRPTSPRPAPTLNRKSSTSTAPRLSTKTSSSPSRTSTPKRQPTTSPRPR